MIQITKEEAAIIRHKYPNVYIAKTVHKRYLPEIYKYLKLIPDNNKAKKILDNMESTIGYEK